ncbi:MAG: hypothetical protein JNM50_13660 [Chromatiales bacterium]|jgi:hypothetical protein|nr:hypothetical protein [Chromatiales bacterium]
MSRSTLVVVALLLLVAALAWLQPWRQSAPEPEPVVAAPPAPAPPPAPATAPEPAVQRPPPKASSPAPATGASLRGRDDLAALLKARGLDPDRAIADLQAWRERRGFLGPDPMNLTGLTPGQSRGEYYATLDPATLANLAASGDVGALQTLAGNRLQKDPAGAIEDYSRAAGQGSAAAMLAISSTMRALAQFPADGVGVDEQLADQLRRVRGGDQSRDLRGDALAWSLAAVRQYGPGVIDRSTLAWIETSARDLPAETVTRACGQSLAIMADLTARGAPAGDLPPVFGTEQGLYDRLPCGSSPVPISPPAGIERCEATEARDLFGQPVSVWTCRGN